MSSDSEQQTATDAPVAIDRTVREGDPVAIRSRLRNVIDPGLGYRVFVADAQGVLFLCSDNMIWRLAPPAATPSRPSHLSMACERLGDEAFDQLCCVAQVSKEIVSFRSELSNLIEFSHLSSSLTCCGNSPEAESAIVGLRRSILKFAAAGRELVERWRSLHETETAEASASSFSLERIAASTELRGLNELPLEAKRSALDLLCEKAIVDCLLLLQHQPSWAGLPDLKRRKGAPENANGKLFIFGLLAAANRAGGKFTFNRKGETSGTRALRILSPFLVRPVWWNPNRMPFATLEAYYKEWKKERAKGGY